MDFGQVIVYVVVSVQYVVWNVFVFWNEGFGVVVQVYIDVVVFGVFDYIGDQFVNVIFLCIDDLLVFGFVYVLDDDLFGSLCGDMVEVWVFDLFFDVVVDFNVVGFVDGIYQVDLVIWGFYYYVIGYYFLVVEGFVVVVFVVD